MKKIKIGYDEHLKKDVYKIIFDKVPDKRLFNSSDVIFGNPSSNVAIAFVYTWKEDKAPAEINNLFIKLSNYAAVIGYWRTTNGGKYVFANILSNPNINKLVVLVFEKEDNGHLLVNALRNISFNSPSSRLAELFNGLATTITSGGDLPEFFDERAKTLLFEYRLEKEKYIKSAETFMDIYISVVIAAPMILMLLLMMMKISGLGIALSTSMITLTMIAGVSLMNIVFLAFLHLKQPGA